MSEFIWTDELKQEFNMHMKDVWANYFNLYHHLQPQPDTLDHLNRFKQSKLKTISKDWEIVEYRAPDNSMTYKVSDPKQWEGTFCKIHSVRRISDNTLWNVGDDTNSGKIVRFEKVDNEMLAYFIHGSFRNIGFLRKPTQQKPYLVFTQPEYGSEMYVPYDYGNVVPEGIFERFETKELAREFCVMNKPCLSIINVMDNCTYIDSQCAVYFANIQVKLKELVEKKLKCLILF